MDSPTAMLPSTNGSGGGSHMSETPASIAEPKPNRELTAWDLTMIGIGGIIGTGIFVLTGQAAAANAGPAVVLSFIIAGVASSFAALCYSEMASMIPYSGSAYTYAYETMGELVAWIIGWDLILEYLVGAAAVAVGLSGYFVTLLDDMFGIQFPKIFASAPMIFDADTEAFIATGSIVNLPAVIAVGGVTYLLVVGIRESARFNSIMVVVKLFVIFLFICATIGHVDPANWTPFVPEAKGYGRYGASGVLQGATTVFFAYIGFDSVSTTASECKNPQRDLPIGIICSLVVCTILYIIVSLLLTGVVSYTKLGVAHPIALGVQATGLRWLAAVVEIGAIAGLSSVLLVTLMGQPRIFWAMAQDGLLPPEFAKIHPKYGTPYVPTVVTGILCAFLAGLLPLDILAELTSIGTLFAFVLVCAGVAVLRVKRPDVKRKFRVPGGNYLIPVLGSLSSGMLIFTAKWQSLIRLAVWMIIGLIIYFRYGKKHSKGKTSHIRNLSDVSLSQKITKDVAMDSPNSQEPQHLTVQDDEKLDFAPIDPNQPERDE
jgi:APA family basic amino acid/polyamine antiporter